ncbi:MAG: extracellular solute-binding protein [Acetobacteraceae bacterium]|nr:extracellular solute-binding protein [Acetobacteraceae bacterium]
MISSPPKDASFAAENYGERILALGRVDGRQAGLAFNASNPICYYNEDLLKRAGVDTATLTESWDNVIAAGAKVRGLGGDISGMAYDVHGWPDGWLFEAMIMQAGGSLLNELGTAVGFDNEIGLAALRTFRRFVTEGGMRLMDWDQSRQQFGAGLTGIYFASPANLAQITGLVGGKFTLRTTTFPITDKQRGRIPTGGNAAVILARDPARARAAWEYVKFITGPLAQKIVVEMTGYLPVNLKASGPEFLGPWYEQNPNARTPILQIERAGPLGCLSRRQHGAHLARPARHHHRRDAGRRLARGGLASDRRADERDDARELSARRCRSWRGAAGASRPFLRFGRRAPQPRAHGRGRGAWRRLRAREGIETEWWDWQGRPRPRLAATRCGRSSTALGCDPDATRMRRSTPAPGRGRCRRCSPPEPGEPLRLAVP